METYLYNYWMECWVEYDVKAQKLEAVLTPEKGKIRRKNG